MQRAIYDPGITVALILSMNSNATLAQVPEAHYGTTLGVSTCHSAINTANSCLFEPGALLLGALFMYALLGLLISQTYSYFRTFPEDWVGLKLLVSVTTLPRSSLNLPLRSAGCCALSNHHGEYRTLLIVFVQCVGYCALNMCYPPSLYPYDHES